MRFSNNWHPYVLYCIKFFDYLKRPFWKINMLADHLKNIQNDHESYYQAFINYLRARGIWIARRVDKMNYKRHKWISRRRFSNNGHPYQLCFVLFFGYLKSAFLTNYARASISNAWKMIFSDSFFSSDV